MKSMFVDDFHESDAQVIQGLWGFYMQADSVQKRCHPETEVDEVFIEVDDDGIPLGRRIVRDFEPPRAEARDPPPQENR